MRALRQERALSVRELASRSGLSERYLGEVEAGRGNLSITKLVGLAAALDRSAAQLLLEAEPTQGPKSQVIALLGVRGAGKSTLGKALAEQLHLEFFELDELIEARAGLSLAEIFSIHGEDYYRRLEREVLERFLSEQPAAVLATGGGIVTHEESLRLLEARAATVWLRADLDDHWDRVVAQGDRRPMAARPAAKAELRRLLAEREALYRRADHPIDTSALGLEGSLDTLVDLFSPRAAA